MMKVLSNLVVFLCLPAFLKGQILFPQECFPNGTVVVENPYPSLFISVFAIQYEGYANATQCPAWFEGSNVIVTGCSLDFQINIFLSDRPEPDNITLGAPNWTSLCVFCGEIPDTGVTQTVGNALGATLEASTQDYITPSFVVTSAIRTGSQVGPVANTAKVGDTLYWTIDIPAAYKGMPTCTAYSGTDKSGTPTKLLVSAGCSDDYDLIGDDFDNDDLSDPSIRRIWTILYAFKFYNSDELYFECFVTICPSSSSSCDLLCSKKKRRSARDIKTQTNGEKSEEGESEEDLVFTTGHMIRIVKETENSGASFTGTILTLIVASLVAKIDF